MGVINRLQDEVRSINENQKIIDAEVRKLIAERDRLRAALVEIGRYTGEGPHTTPWQAIVRDLGSKARYALRNPDSK